MMNTSLMHTSPMCHSHMTQLLERVLLQKQLRVAFPAMLMDEVIAYPLVWPC